MILGVIEIKLLQACFNVFKWPGSTVESSLLHVQYTRSILCSVQDTLRAGSA